MGEEGVLGATEGLSVVIGGAAFERVEFGSPVFDGDGEGIGGEVWGIGEESAGAGESDGEGSEAYGRGGGAEVFWFGHCFGVLI